MKTRAFALPRNTASMGTGKTRAEFWKSFSTYSPVKKTTILDIYKKFNEKIPISMVTAYDYTSAIAVDTSGIDMILVGDSAGMVMMGLENTSQVTMEDIIHHCKSVKRGSKRAFLVGDMPFGSYEISPTEAVRNATRLMKEGQMEAVKMEGGRRIKGQVKAVVAAGIPVIGHIGLTPQTSSALGGFRVQGKTADQARNLLEDALELQECGVAAIVIEAVPAPVSSYITSRLSIPTIGIGAGSGTSGQVLVFHDMLGLYPNLAPKFSKQYLSLSPTIQNALENFKKEVESRVFPGVEHSYTMKNEEFLKAFPDAAPISSVQSIGDSKDLKSEKSNEIRVVEAKSETTDIKNSVKKTSSQPETTTEKKSPPVSFSSPSKEKKRTIAIIGGGSMGSLVSGRLAASGDTNIWMISSWKEHVDKINHSGLVLQNLDKSTCTVQLRATTSVEEVIQKDGKVDLAVVMVKSPHTKEAALKAAQLVHSNGFVLTLQNGLGNREIIAEALGGDIKRVIQGVTSHGGNILSSGHVAHTGIGVTSLAIDNHNKWIVEEIAQIFHRAGLVCDLNENLESLQWGKLIVNSAINPLTAILRVKNGVLAESPACIDLVAKTVKEGVLVANARGVALPFGDPVNNVLSVARSTKDNVSSMLKDVMRGEKTEIDAINGAIVREGDRLGVGVFINRTMIGLLELQHTLSPQQVLHFVQ